MRFSTVKVSFPWIELPGCSWLICYRRLEAWFHRNNEAGRPYRAGEFDTGSPRFHRVCIAVGSSGKTICRAVTSARMASRNDESLTNYIFLRTFIKLSVGCEMPGSIAEYHHRCSSWSLSSLQWRREQCWVREDATNMENSNFRRWKTEGWFCLISLCEPVRTSLSAPTITFSQRLATDGSPGTSSDVYDTFPSTQN
jgi:hypothetical protein